MARGCTASSHPLVARVIAANFFRSDESIGIMPLIDNRHFGLHRGVMVARRSQLGFPA